MRAPTKVVVLGMILSFLLGSALGITLMETGVLATRAEEVDYAAVVERLDDLEAESEDLSSTVTGVERQMDVLLATERARYVLTQVDSELDSTLSEVLFSVLLEENSDFALWVEKTSEATVVEVLASWTERQRGQLSWRLENSSRTSEGVVVTVASRLPLSIDSGIPSVGEIEVPAMTIRATVAVTPDPDAVEVTSIEADLG